MIKRIKKLLKDPEKLVLWLWFYAMIIIFGCIMVIGISQEIRDNNDQAEKTPISHEVQDNNEQEKKRPAILQRSNR